MQKAASKFNNKPKNGISYLLDQGHIPKEAGELQTEKICHFIKSTPSLSATAIGEYLGQDKEPNKGVLALYTDQFDWTSSSISFVDALKMYLTGFRIPGEGQVVDRFMEKFGDKLSKDRPLEFSNTEGVYLLAYATLMLQTSVHNPQAQKMKMKLDDFKKITKFVKLTDAEWTERDSFLENLYDTVCREPFTLEEDEDARLKLESSLGANKKALFNKEREGILRRGTNILKQDSKQDKFVSIKDISTIRPMFENTWSAYVAVFSTNLESTDDLMIADICLQGFIHAIRISGHFEMDQIRNNFVSSLSKLTNISDTKEIK